MIRREVALEHQAIKAAREAALLRDHNYVGTEHLLLGILSPEDDSPASQILGMMGVHHRIVSSMIDFITGSPVSITFSDPTGLNPTALQVVDLAVDSANTFQSEHFTAEHLLLGLIREGHGIAIGILEGLGVRLPQLEDRVLSYLHLGKILAFHSERIPK